MQLRMYLIRIRMYTQLLIEPQKIVKDYTLIMLNNDEHYDLIVQEYRNSL